MVARGQGLVLRVIENQEFFLCSQAVSEVLELYLYVYAPI